MVRERGNVAGVVNLGDPFVFSLARFDSHESSGCAALLQLLYNRAQPIGRLGMPGSHIVFEICRVIDETGLSQLITFTTHSLPCKS
jgi:hypothetical protein